MNILRINLRTYSLCHVVLDFYIVSVCEHVTCFTEHVHFYYTKRKLRCLSKATTTELLNMLISYII